MHIEGITRHTENHTKNRQNHRITKMPVPAEIIEHLVNCEKEIARNDFKSDCSRFCDLYIKPMYLNDFCIDTPKFDVIKGVIEEFNDKSTSTKIRLVKRRRTYEACFHLRIEKTTKFNNGFIDKTFFETAHLHPFSSDDFPELRLSYEREAPNTTDHYENGFSTIYNLVVV